MEREAYPHMPDMASNPKKDMYFAASVTAELQLPC